MADNLLDVVSSFSREQLQNIPRADLEAIRDGRDREVSRDSLLWIRDVQTNLGLGEYLDVGTSIGGALAGARLGATVGAAGGVPGVVAGSLIGGVAGTFGGEILEDLLAGRPIEAGFEEGGAGREAATTALWDSIFLGSGKILRGVGNALGIDPLRHLGVISAQEKVVEIDKIADLSPDTIDGARQLNNYLVQSGGGLTVS